MCFSSNRAATIDSFLNTLIVSGLGALLGVLLAWLISYFTLRHRPPGYRILDLTASLPFGVPGVVLGLGLLWAYAYLPLPIYGTLTILIVRVHHALPVLRDRNHRRTDGANRPDASKKRHGRQGPRAARR